MLGMASSSRATWLALLTIAVSTTTPLVTAQSPESARRSASVAARLTATAHPALPGHPSQFWIVPETSATRRSTGRAADDAASRLARGIQLIGDRQFTTALPLVSAGELARGPLSTYAQYYTGVALIGLSRFAEADTTLTALAARRPQGYLKELVALRLADVAVARQDASRAEDLLEELSEEKLSAPEDVFLKLGTAEEAVGHREHALDAYRRVYYDFPMSRQAADAQAGIERLQTLATMPTDIVAREMTRSEALFAAKRWAQARAGFDGIRRVVPDERKDLIALRIAECDYYLERHRASRDALVPLVNNGSQEAEARFFHVSATRGLGDHANYVTLARKLVADHPSSEWAAETLNGLATHYIVIDDDASADFVFRELLRKFPQHRYAERAASRSGWWAYREDKFEETATIFENAAATFPRADSRPMWLYWSGRSREQLGDRATAVARYRLVVADYQNTYYGRLAAKLLAARREAAAADGVGKEPASVTATPGPTDALIRALLAAELYDEAVAEVQYAQRVWGDSPQLQATLAWTRHRQGLGLKATDRFNALRGAINTMRRAYPQFMAAGGEDLPPDVLRIIFPLDFWPLITKYSEAHDLDPYLIAALMAQESTFTPEIRSHANAYGLMQVVPDTGRRVARQLGIRRFSTSMLMQPEMNVRLGMKYFKDMVDQFGGVHYALAGYNAGPHRVSRWLKESPGLPQDEFIDNIPYQETQTYVKRILGTAEDYRTLYGPAGPLNPDTRPR
jgi:soluble lytic murein transglycosylase